MEAAKLHQTLKKHSVIALDSCVLIYFLEDNPRFGELASRILRVVADGGPTAIISAIALLEVQVGAYKAADTELASRYFALLKDMPGWTWVPVTYEIADRAAELRAVHNISAPDALHLATAIDRGATLFITNDQRLPVVEGIEYLFLGN